MSIDGGPDKLPDIPRLEPISLLGMCHDEPRSPTPSSPSGSQHHLAPPPTSIRKSLSVDSLISYRRADASQRAQGSLVTLPSRSVGERASLQPARRTSAATSASAKATTWSDRNSAFEMSMKRTGGLAAMRDFHEPRLEELRGVVPPRISRTGAPKPGQLMLPPRQTLSSVPVGTQVSPSMSIVPDSLNAPRIVVPPGRERSGSVISDASSEPTSMFSSMQEEHSNGRSEVCIAVVGSKTCGKTTAIRKGLKGYSLSEATQFHVSKLTDRPAPFSYVIRQGKIPRSRDDHEQPFSVLEVDIQPALVHKLGSGRIEWPKEAPTLDGIAICYDVSDNNSFQHVHALLDGFSAAKLPIVALACKSDRPRRVDSKDAAALLKKYDVGLIEVTAASENGKDKMRTSFDWLIQSIFRHRRDLVRSLSISGESRLGASSVQYRNPASPNVLFEPAPWDERRSEAATPTPSSLGLRAASPVPTIDAMSHKSELQPRPTSPTRARSMGDLLLESERSRGRSRDLTKEHSVPIVLEERPPRASFAEPDPIDRAIAATGALTSESSASMSDSAPEPEKYVERVLQPPHWQTVEDLLHKLVFVGITGDDNKFVSRFLLVYRCFAIPQTILLAMQRALLSFDSSPEVDTMFAKFCQGRICHILDIWITEYPYDFAVPGAASALSEVIKSVSSKLHLLHYTSSFVPSLDMVPHLVDADSLWAMPVPAEPGGTYGPDDTGPGLDQSAPNFIDQPSGSRGADYAESPVSGAPSFNRSATSLSQSTRSVRERKASLPVGTRSSSLAGAASPSTGFSSDVYQRHVLRELWSVSQDLNSIDPGAVAAEIHRVQMKMFLDIKPRDWLHWAYRYSKKDLASDPVARFLHFVNHLAEWVASLILCHDKSKARAKQIERLVDIAQKLRNLDNFSACRSFVAGINHVVVEGDLTMEVFYRKAPEKHKQLRSYNILFKNHRAHGAYRQALNTAQGACVPDVEVHSSDILKAHEGNIDSDPSDPTKIHWAKWNMIARFIHELVQMQQKCRDSLESSVDDGDASDEQRLDPDGEKRIAAERTTRHENMLMDRIKIQKMWADDAIMDAEMQRQRMVPPGESHYADDQILDYGRVSMGRTESKLDRLTGRDGVIKRLLFR